METRTLDVQVISARDIQDVNYVTKMSVYVAVSLLSGDAHTSHKFRTFVDKDAGRNPNWNDCVMKFSVDPDVSHLSRQYLLFTLISDATYGEKPIGQVKVSIKELLDSVGDDKLMKYVNFPVWNTRNKSRGLLYFSYKFGADSASYPFFPTPPPYAGPHHLHPHHHGYARNPPPPINVYMPPPPAPSYPPYG